MCMWVQNVYYEAWMLPKACDSCQLLVPSKYPYSNIQNVYLGNNWRVIRGNWKFPLITYTRIPWIITHSGNFNKAKIPKYFRHTNVCMRKIMNEYSMKEQRNSLNTWIFGFVGDIDAWPDLLYDFLRFGLS